LGSDDWVNVLTFNTILSAVPDFPAALAVAEKMKKEKVALDADSYGRTSPPPLPLRALGAELLLTTRSLWRRARAPPGQAGTGQHSGGLH
jgi:hypothetical protein